MDLTGATWRTSSYSSANGGQCVEVAAVWRKSSHSSGNGGNCIEVAAGWQKSSHSSGNGGACVEVARDLPGAVAVRDSKDPEGPKLAFTPAEWRTFTGSLKDGRFTLA
jgi:Domain of unknown function (DUF397)